MARLYISRATGPEKNSIAIEIARTDGNISPTAKIIGVVSSRPFPLTKGVQPLNTYPGHFRGIFLRGV